MRKLIGLIGLIASIAVTASAASSIDDYRSRLNAAISQLGSVRDESTRIAAVKELLPPTESIDLEDRSIEIDNRWLHVLLDSASNEEEESARNQKLSEAAASLRHIESELVPDDRSVSGSPEARDKLQQILSRPEFQPKRDPLAELIKKAKTKMIELLEYLYQLIFAPVSKMASTAGPILRIVVIVVPLIALFYAVRVVARFRRTKKTKETMTVLGEEIEEGTSADELASAGIDAARSGDFRTGIRKLYIALLYELAQRNLIQLEANATNREYLATVSRFKAVEVPMRYLTDSFDYAWYGMFMPSSDDFSTCLRSYREAVANARSLAQ